jgi:hypothetical protein
MTAHAAFMQHPNGRVVQVHTVADAMYYRRRGYEIGTWDDWYTYQCWLNAERERQAALRKDGGDE